MISAHEAQCLILEHTLRLEFEEIPLSESLHRNLAGSLSAPIALPPFDNSAMDGFAVQSNDTREASEKNPLSLKVIGTTAAGDTPLKIAPGEAVRIMTGAPIPQGADAVIPFEEIVSLHIVVPVLSGAHIRRAGEDVSKASEIFGAGEKMTPRTIALLAALGISKVSVFKKPTVRILSTGSELVEPGQSLSSGKIYNSNGPALEATLREFGIEAQTMGVAVDTEDSLKKGLILEDTDVLITIGGVSAGDFDLVPKVLKDLGAKIIFHKVAIKPGKPLLYATLKSNGKSPRHIFALPGNPVSALVVFDRFVRPALLKMMGEKNLFKRRQEAGVEGSLKGSNGKEDYLRGIVETKNGRWVARSAGPQGSAQLLTLAHANAILFLPETVSSLKEGDSVSFEFFEDVL